MSESVSTLGSGSAILNGRPKIPKVLIACSGSVATLKVPELVAELVPHFEVMVILTSSASFFLEKAQEYNESAWKKFEAAGGWNLVLKDEDEWQMWNAIGMHLCTTFVIPQ
jgi:phosphopantothenoylcysteine decarboxylase